MDTLAHPKYRPDIDGLRAVAVLLVVFFHAFPGRLRSGFIGVDIFFVISGYLISTILFQSLAENRFRFREFYSRRILRIFPALGLVLTASFGLGWFLLSAGELRALGKHMAGGAAFLSNFVLWKESGYFDAAAESKPLLHLWSLGIEEQFYLLYPCFLWLLHRAGAKLRIGVLALALVSFGINLFQVQHDLVASFYSPLTRFWELMLGGLLAGWMLGRDASAADRLSNLRSWAGAALILVGALFISRERSFPGWWALLPTLGAACLISAGPQSTVNRSVLSSRILVWFGLISYPLYLWHWSIFSFVYIANLEPIPTLYKTALVLLSVWFAWLTYRFLETPMRFGPNRRRKTLGLIAGMALVGGLGFWSYRGDGFAGRAVAQSSKALGGYENIHAFEETLGIGKPCFLFDQSDSRAFASHGCEDRPFPGRPSVAIVGDSHAAYLSLGLRPYLESRRLNFVQYTFAYCPPLALTYGKRCEEMSGYVLGQLKRAPPEVLILFAHYSWWEETAGKAATGVAFDDLIFKRAIELSKAGIPRVVIVGPTPTWERDLPQVLMRQFVFRGKEIPKRTFERLSLRTLELDELYRKKPYPEGVSYVSLKDFFCDSSGCLTTIGPNLSTDLVLWDRDHLTLPAAKQVTEKLLGKFFPAQN